MKLVADRLFKVLFLLVLLEGIATSCITSSHGEKYYERQEAKKAAEDQKAYEQSVNVHNKSQTKETLKMIKKTEREAKKLNKSRIVKTKKC